MFFGLFGKVWLVAISAELYFGLGIVLEFRLVKTPSTAGNISGTITWDSMRLSEQHIYGSTRVGMALTNVKLFPSAPKNPHLTDTSHYTIFEGWKRYEITNHLGNVLAVITDRKRGAAASGTAIQWFDADVVASQQYYPFGMLMPGSGTTSLRRQYTLGSNDYRFGFNGKEGDDEVKGDDNQQDYGMRIYDPRVGRFLSMDPIAREYPWYSPYQFAGNMPIWAIDLDGLEPVVIEPGTKTLVIFINGFTENPKEGETQVYPDMNGLGKIALGLQDKEGVQVATFASHRGDVTKNDVIESIRSLSYMDPSARVVLIGHSQGGDNIVEIVKENSDIYVDLAILIDSNDGSNLFMGVPDDNIPENVFNVINYHQKTETFLTGISLEKDDIKNPETTNFADILAKGSIHTSIDGDVAPYALEDINNFLKNPGTSEAVNIAKNRELPEFVPSENDRTSSQISTHKYSSSKQ